VRKLQDERLELIATEGKHRWQTPTMLMKKRRASEKTGSLVKPGRSDASVKLDDFQIRSKYSRY